MNSTFPLSEIHNHVSSKVDVFICASSFEKRCLSVATSLDPSKIGCVLMAQNENNVEYVGENGKRLLALFGDKADKIILDTNNPLTGTDNIIKNIKRTLSDQPQTFLFDISTFTRESLLIIISLLHHYLKPSDTLQIVYVAAREYSGNTQPSPASEAHDGSSKIWLSRGVREIRSVLTYPGEGLPSRDLHLLILVGFEYERAAQLVDVYEPTVLSLGYSEDETSSGHAQKNKEFHKKVSALYSYEANKFTFSAIDPIVTRDAILAEVNRFPNYNTVLSAMNTKLSTIGAAFAAFTNEAIQICYAQAETYNIEGYAEPQDRFFLFSPLMEDFVVDH